MKCYLEIQNFAIHDHLLITIFVNIWEMKDVPKFYMYKKQARHVDFGWREVA